MYVDYLKIHDLPVKAEKVLDSHLLTFPLSNIATTGEVLNRAQIAHYKGLQIIVRNGKVGLKGSLHKYRQGGKNYEDFSLDDVREVINEISQKFDFDPESAKINFIEIGVNITVDKDPSEIIKSIVLYRNSPFQHLHVKGNGYGRICDMQQITIKIYNKSLQFGLQYHLLRFEVKIKRMKFLERYGISNLTLAELKRFEIYTNLQRMLLEIFKGILFFDPKIDPENIKNQKDRELFIQGKYFEFWQSMEKVQRHRKKKRFIELANSEKINREISELINEKCNQLTTLRKNQINKESNQLTTFQSDYENPKLKTINHFSETYEKAKLKPFNTTIDGYSRVCPITGMDITIQKKNSSLLSNTGLSFLRKKHPEKYDEIKKRFLPRSGVSGLHTEFEPDEINHLSKQIRNEYYNSRRQREKIPACQLELLAF